MRVEVDALAATGLSLEGELREAHVRCHVARWGSAARRRSYRELAFRRSNSGAVSGSARSPRPRPAHTGRAALPRTSTAEARARSESLELPRHTDRGHGSWSPSELTSTAMIDSFVRSRSECRRRLRAMLAIVVGERIPSAPNGAGPRRRPQSLADRRKSGAHRVATRVRELLNPMACARFMGLHPRFHHQCG